MERLVDGPTIYAGTFNGVFRSTNNGTNWQAVNTGLGNLKVRTLSKSGTNIVAGTDSLVWIRPISDLTVGADVLSAAENMQATVYPNPSNGFFSIEFSDFTTQTSVLGEKVFSSPLDSPHSEIDLRHKPSGIYIYHIKRENKAIATGKISIE